MVGKGEIFIEQDTKELIGAGRWIRMIGVDAFKYRDFARVMRGVRIIVVKYNRFIT